MLLLLIELFLCKGNKKTVKTNFMYVQRRYARRPIEIHILTYSKHEMTEQRNEKKIVRKIWKQWDYKNETMKSIIVTIKKSIVGW